MKVIIPAKAGSTRVENKNWRPFTPDGECLVELLIFKLGELVGWQNIHVTCEDESNRNTVEQYGCNFLHISHEGNDDDFRKWVKGTCDVVAPNETIAWAQVTTPFFDEHKRMLDVWKKYLEGSRWDSFCAVHPVKQYLLDTNKHPVGWQWGPWHRKSQRLPKHYIFPWSFSILTPAAREATGYHIGKTPYWFECDCGVDIDTEEQFEFAQWKYAREAA